MTLRPAPVDHARVAAAVRAAEAGTRAELVCVMARCSSSYEFFPLLWAALASLATPAVLLPATRLAAEHIYLIQLGVFAVALAALSISSLRFRLVPRALLRRRAHRAAAEQFLLRGLTRKAERTGVLIFVSEAERYARIIADSGVADLVPEARWQGAVALLLKGARDGQLEDGFCAAIAACGAELAARLPPVPGQANELPDRFFVI